MRRHKKHVVTLRQLRDRFSELLISTDAPVMVTKNGVPLGFFLPAKVWKSQVDSSLSRHVVEVVLVHAGCTKESVQACIDESSLHKRRLSHMAVDGR